MKKTSLHASTDAGPRPQPIPISRPDLSGNERAYVDDCLVSTWISSRGGYIGRFSDAFAVTVGAPFALPCSSGTTALQLALHGLGIGPGDEVILPDVTLRRLRQCRRPLWCDAGIRRCRP